MDKLLIECEAAGLLPPSADPTQANAGEIAWESFMVPLGESESPAAPASSRGGRLDPRTLYSRFRSSRESPGQNRRAFRERFSRTRSWGVLARNRSHVLPMRNPSPGESPGGNGALFSPDREKEEKTNSERRTRRANRTILLLAIVALAWTVILLLTSPMIIDIHLKINDYRETALREELELAQKITPIQLPWSDVTSPNVDSFSHLVKAEDICPSAHKASLEATDFEKQFGAHEFQRVSEEHDTKHRRVALFTAAYSNIRDGVSLTLNKMVAFLEANGHEFETFAPTTDEPALDPVGKVLSVPSIPCPGSPEYRQGVFLSSDSRRELSEFDPDIVHIATPDLAGFHALLWAKLNRVPTACSYHTRYNKLLSYSRWWFAEPASWLVWGMLYGNCDHVYVPSKEIREELKDHGIEKNVRMWARGVDGDVFNPRFRCPAWRSSIGVEEEEVVVLLVSRMVWEKNLELFARTVEGLQASGLKFKSVIVGEGPAREELQRRLPRTAFLGELEGADLSTAYANADVFLFPSVTETFGSTTLEAMASGLPVVVADSSGSSSIVRHDVNGFVADPEDVQSFVDYTARLISDSDLRNKMGANGVRIAENEFQYGKIFGDLMGFYDDLLMPERTSNQLDG